jgi:hypothetical protein
MLYCFIVKIIDQWLSSIFVFAFASLISFFLCLFFTLLVPTSISTRPQVFNSFLTALLGRLVVVMVRKNQNCLFVPPPPLHSYLFFCLFAYSIFLSFVHDFVYLIGGSHTGTFEFIKKHGYVPYGTFFMYMIYFCC